MGLGFLRRTTRDCGKAWSGMLCGHVASAMGAAIAGLLRYSRVHVWWGGGGEGRQAGRPVEAWEIGDELGP